MEIQQNQGYDEQQWPGHQMQQQVAVDTLHLNPLHLASFRMRRLRVAGGPRLDGSRLHFFFGVRDMIRELIDVALPFRVCDELGDEQKDANHDSVGVGHF
jgi:hypothetical protein